ncbi:glycosyltransferase family 2 protein [Aidingimonas lacisalsi]|uniref:glycosyltransferase family 2 protein n=1 Tax=Aidingimonas lacisalsi TaxID=2604086 RepID=UPI0011D2440E|nr:glycosyltransferase family 2 protein [Aidingimonas lacisalsi]
MRKENHSTTRKIVSSRPKIFDEENGRFYSLVKLPQERGKISDGGLRFNGKFKEDSKELPLVTVVTVVFNDVDNIEKTLCSVVQQTYSNIEYIVVDGGSNDGTLDIIKEYSHLIDYWVSENDEGIYDAMNKGITLASGQWVNFMNSGDRFFSTSTVEDIGFDQLSSYNLIYGDKQERGNIIKAYPERMLEKGILHACHQSMFFKKTQHTSKVLKYNLKFSIYSDYDLVNRYYNKLSRFYYVDKPLAVFQGEGVSSTTSWQKRSDKYISVYESYGTVGVIRAICFRISSLFGK